MKTAKAILNNYRQSPRKVRMVANAVRGKKVSEVLINLDFIAKRSSLPIKNLILSAVANAKNLEIPTENLIIKTIKVDGGPIMYRRQPASRGRAHPIRKRTSSITIELGEKESKNKTEVVKKTEVIEDKKEKVAKTKVTKAKTSKPKVK